MWQLVTKCWMSYQSSLKIMYYWARLEINIQNILRHCRAGLSSRSTWTDRLKGQLKCVGWADFYWKSFSHLFPQGFCPSTREALQTYRAQSQSLFWLFGHILQKKRIKGPQECTKQPQCGDVTKGGFLWLQQLLTGWNGVSNALYGKPTQFKSVITFRQENISIWHK